MFAGYFRGNRNLTTVSKELFVVFLGDESWVDFCDRMSEASLKCLLGLGLFLVRFSRLRAVGRRQ
jgi:hypothetical protein